MPRAWLLALLVAFGAGNAAGQGPEEGAVVPFRIPFRAFFYDAKLDTGQAEVPSVVVRTFVDSAGVKHRLTWRPGFDVRVTAKRKRLGLPPFKARGWQVSGLAVSLSVDLDGKVLTSFQFEVKRADRFEVEVRDSTFVTRNLPGGDFHSALVGVIRPRVEFRGNDETLQSSFVADLKVAGRMAP